MFKRLGKIIKEKVRTRHINQSFVKMFEIRNEPKKKGAIDRLISMKDDKAKLYVDIFRFRDIRRILELKDDDIQNLIKLGRKGGANFYLVRTILEIFDKLNHEKILHNTNIIPFVIKKLRHIDNGIRYASLKFLIDYRQLLNKNNLKQIRKLLKRRNPDFIVMGLEFVRATMDMESYDMVINLINNKNKEIRNKAYSVGLLLMTQAEKNIREKKTMFETHENKQNNPNETPLGFLLKHR